MEKTHTLNTLPYSLELLPLHLSELLELPISQSYVAAGFPSPAEDYLEDKINLQKVLIRNPTATYLVRVRGESMRDARLRPAQHRTNRTRLRHPPRLLPAGQGFPWCRWWKLR